MPFVHGKAAKLYVNGWDLSPFLSKITTASKADTAEISTLGTTDKQYLNGMMEATLSADGFHDDANNAVTSVMGSAFINPADDVVTHLPQGDVFGGRSIGMVNVLSDFEVSTDTGGVGAVVIAGTSDDVGRCVGVILHPIGQVVATGASAVIDNGAVPASTPYGLDSYLQVTQCTTGPLVVKVQHSSDNITYVDLCVHTSVAGAASVHTAERISSDVLVPGRVILRYLKSSWTLTAGSATFQHSASRLTHTH